MNVLKTKLNPEWPPGDPASDMGTENMMWQEAFLELLFASIALDERGVRNR